MGSTKNRRVIALSLKPKFAHAILNKKKTVEFRRNGVPSAISNIVIYSTSPDRLILGYCDVIECVIKAPDKLWEEYGDRGYISYDEYLDYYKGCEMGKCYLLDNPQRFLIPITIEKCISFSSAPQSFAYVNKNEWKNLKRKKLI